MLGDMANARGSYIHASAAAIIMTVSIFRRECWYDAKIMCGRVLAFLILPTQAIGSLVGARNKTCCHLAWWKVSKRTAMRFGTWANLHGSEIFPLISTASG